MEGDETTSPDHGHSSAGKERLQCYKCGSTFYFGGADNRADCSSCGAHIPVWRARLAAYGESKFIAALADGPKVADDLDAEPTTRTRDVIQKLRPPGNNQSGKARVVYFLPGDERRAVDRFIRANEPYVRECLSKERNNQLAEGWSDGLYQLLVEQWHWNGYDIAGRAEE